MTLSRRSLITGLVSFAATAPAIVRATSLMPVKQILLEPAQFGLDFALDGSTTAVTIVNPGSGYVAPPMLVFEKSDSSPYVRLRGVPIHLDERFDSI